GGGTPGIPLAAVLPDREVTLVEAERRKCDFLEQWPTAVPNLRVVWGRAEEQPLEGYGVAVAKALAHPPTAAEWCLPLVREGGLVVLWVGESAEPQRVAGGAGRGGGASEQARGRGGARRGIARAGSRGPARDSQDGADAARIPPPHGRREEASAGLTKQCRQGVPPPVWR